MFHPYWDSDDQIYKLIEHVTVTGAKFEAKRQVQ